MLAELPNSGQMIPLEEHMRIIREKDQKIHRLERRLRFREELDGVSSEIMSQNQKAALSRTVKEIQSRDPEPDGWFLLEKTDELAKDSGMATKTYQKCLTYCDTIGTLEKKTKKIRDEDTGEVVRIDTYVKPTSLTTYPRMYEAEKDRNHGGERLRCRCGSEQIQKETRYICKGCGEVHSEPPRFYPPESFEPPVEPVEPEDQFGFLVENEAVQKTNLTLLSNNYPEGQVGPVVEDESNIPPTSVPAAADHESIIRDWLDIRFGTNRVIHATEKLTQEEKYFTLPESYTPDIDAFIRGDIGHIYGSRLLSSDGKTQVLSFDVDYHNTSKPNPHWLERAQDWIWAFRRAGVTAVYWQRGQGGHFELYFDEPVYPERARYWAYSICPDLEEIPECYPCQSVAKKYLSWPMWQRKANLVKSTPAHVMLPEPYEGGLQEIDPTDKEALARLITVAVTPVQLVEEFSARADAMVEEQKRGKEIDSNQGGDIGIKSKPLTQVGGNRDLVPQVIADFNACYSWDDIAAMAGGWSDKDYFKAVWRGERTASVKPDKDGRYAKDWGNYGSFPEKLDRYGAYCLIHGIDQKADLAERCAEYRRQQAAVAAPEEG